MNSQERLSSSIGVPARESDSDYLARALFCAAKIGDDQNFVHVQRQLNGQRSKNPRFAIDFYIVTGLASTERLGDVNKARIASALYGNGIFNVQYNPDVFNLQLMSAGEIEKAISRNRVLDRKDSRIGVKEFRSLF